MNKTILVDVDGVIANSHSEWLRKYNTEYDDHLLPENITGWDMHLFVKPECGKKIYEYLWDDGLYNNVEPIDGALSSIRWIRDRGHRVIFVTSGIQPYKILWLNNQGFLEGSFWRSPKDVVISSDKSIIKGEYLIDDNIENCKKFDGISFLFSQPWNKNELFQNRVHSWPDIIDTLHGKI